MYVDMYVCMYVYAKRGARGPKKGPKGPPWELEGWSHSAQIDFLVLKIIYNFYPPCKNIIEL